MEQYSIIHVLFILILTLYTPNIDTSRSSIRSNKLVSYSIPEKRQLKKALGFNEDIYLNFTELTTKYGYPTEEHFVTTDDGFILSVMRILPKCSASVKSYPVLLWHGIFDSADTWIVTGDKAGLGYILANNCYDVWAANTRGNGYSRRHIRLDPDKDPEFWNFSFDENGYYDVPATIDYILQKTGFTKLFYIGHSQGTTQYFTMCSLKPEYNQKVVLGVQLAPVAWFINVNNPIAVAGARNYKFLLNILESIGLSQLFGRDRIEHLIGEFLCEAAPNLCEIGYSLFTGLKKGTISLKNISVTIGHFFNGGSLKNLAHYAQLIVSGAFRRYDEGVKGNLQRYGLPEPPPYNVSLITSPIVMMSGQSDALSSLKDVEMLASKLPNVVDNYLVPDKDWSHNSHIWDNKAPEMVFSKILEYLDKYKNQS